MTDLSDPILPACRLAPPPEAVERLADALAESPERAERLYARAARWDVAALVGCHLVAQSAAAGSAPSAGAGPFVRRYRTVQAQNILRLTVVRPLLTDLAREVGPVVPLKGLDLLDRLYSDPGQRPMEDFDVLVQEDRFEAAAAYLESRGAWLDPEVMDPRLEELAYAWSFRIDHEVPMRLELHRWLFQPEMTPLDHDALWARTLGDEPASDALLPLSDSDTLLYCATHAAKHGFRPFGRLVDLAELSRRNPNWQEVVALAERRGARATAWAALTLATAWFDAPVPAEALRPLRPGPTARALTAALARLALHARSKTRPTVRWRRLLREALCQDDARKCLAYLARRGRLSLRTRGLTGPRRTP